MVDIVKLDWRPTCIVDYNSSILIDSVNGVILHYYKFFSSSMVANNEQLSPVRFGEMVIVT